MFREPLVTMTMRNMKELREGKSDQKEVIKGLRGSPQTLLQKEKVIFKHINKDTGRSVNSGASN